MLEGPWVEKKNAGGWEQRLLWPPRSNMHQPATWIVDSKAPKNPNGDIGPEDSIIMKCPKSPTNGPTERSPKKPWATKIPPLMSIGRPGKGNYKSKLICFNPGGQSRIVNFTQKQVRHTGRSKSLQGFLDLLETKRTSRRLLWPSKHFLFGFSIPYIFTYTFQTKSIDKCRSIFHTSGQIAINNLKKLGNSDGTP